MTALEKCSHSFPETSHKKAGTGTNCSQGKLGVDVMFIVIVPSWPGLPQGISCVSDQVSNCVLTAGAMMSMMRPSAPCSL